MNLANQKFGLQEKLVELLNVKETPSVSILVPNDEPQSAEKLRIQIKDDIKNAILELKQMHLDKKLILALEKRLHKGADFIRYQKQFRSLGLFVSNNTLEVIYLPVMIEHKVIVDHSFEIRDILLSVNRTFHYDVLLLNKKKTRFFNGFGQNLQELDSSDIPSGVDEYFNKEKSSGGDTSKKDLIATQHYIKALDYFLRVHTSPSIPLILIGDVKLLSYFKKYTRKPVKVLGEIQGSFHRENLLEIKQIIQPSLKDFQEKWENQLIESMKDEIDHLRYVSGIQEVWEAAAMNEARILILEKGYKQEGYSTQNGLFFVFDKKYAPQGQYREDAVDDIIEMVLGQGGESYFVAPGKLKAFDRIFLNTRY